MNIPNEDDIYDLLDNLADACICTDTICLYCQAEQAIDELIVQNLINQYRNKRRTWRCRR